MKKGFFKKKMLVWLMAATLAFSAAMTAFAEETEPAADPAPVTVTDPETEEETEKETETVTETETETETEPATEPETEPTTEPEVADIITNVKSVSSSWSAPYDHTVAKTFYEVTLAEPATLVWSIYYPDGTLFNEYSGEFDAGVASLTWTAVDPNGWHPEGTSSNRTEVAFEVVIAAVNGSGQVDAASDTYTFYFAHSIKQHLGYVEPEQEEPVQEVQPENPVTTTNNDVPKTGESHSDYGMMLYMAVIFGAGFVVTRKLSRRA